ncbi:MAG: RNA methyltransferase [Chromatiales bacterium]
MGLRDKVRIVLVEPTHPGNIGAAARAMRTMGLARLALVRPSQFPCAQATAMAAGADDLLVRARVCETLGEALAGCSLVVGTSARARRIPWPVLDPRAAARQVVQAAAAGEVAIVFGREHAGLSNEEVELCQAVVQIPSDPDFSSLNLAAAVQVMAYELRMTSLDSAHAVGDESSRDSLPATSDELARLYAHFEATLVQVGFLDPEKPRRLMRRLRRLFNRAGLDQNEVNILRGFLTAVQDKTRPS